MPLFQDTVYFVDDFQAETPIKNGRLSSQDVQLAERLLSQVIFAMQHIKIIVVVNK